MTNYIDIYIYFIIYSFLGWVTESVYCSLGDGELVNRGFVTGPFCPIYGFGALLILRLLTSFTNDFLTIFLAGMAITSVLEYVSSYILEVTFNTKWWDYSTYKFNLHGRVCLKNSLLFGLLCVALHFYIHPWIEFEVGKANLQNLEVITIAFTVVFTADFSHAVYTILKLNNKLMGLEQIKKELSSKSYEVGQELGIDAVLVRVRKYKQLARSTRFEFETVEDVYRTFYKKLMSLKLSEKRLIRAFPKMRNLKVPYIQAMREYINNKKDSES